MTGRSLHKVCGRLLPVLFVLLGACASIPPQVKQLDSDASVVELSSTPFFSQQRYQCGPAALTTALRSSGVDVSLQEVVDKVYLPGRAGSLQLEMIAATRTSGRVPYLIDGKLSALLEELEAGRPVVVLQNLGVAVYPRWHYAVVVGIDPRRGEVILRSGTDKRRVTAVRTFLHTWRRSDYWALVVLRPGELPENVDQVRYFGAVAGLEQAGRFKESILAWRAALGEWPDHPVALFGLANAMYAEGIVEEAVATYERLLWIGGELPAARNNLAMALAELGEFDQALRQIERATESTVDPALLSELAKSRQEINQLLLDND